MFRENKLFCTSLVQVYAINHSKIYNYINISSLMPYVYMYVAENELKLF